MSEKTTFLRNIFLLLLTHFLRRAESQIELLRVIFLSHDLGALMIYPRTATIDNCALVKFFRSFHSQYCEFSIKSFEVVIDAHVFGSLNFFAIRTQMVVNLIIFYWIQN